MPNKLQKLLNDLSHGPTIETVIFYIYKFINVNCEKYDKIYYKHKLMLYSVF